MKVLKNQKINNNYIVIKINDRVIPNSNFLNNSFDKKKVTFVFNNNSSANNNSFNNNSNSSENYKINYIDCGIQGDGDDL